MIVSDRVRQEQRGGFWSTNLQAYKIEIHQGGMRESVAPDIARSDPEAHIGGNDSVDGIRERVLELLNRHRIDPPTMAEILEVPLSMLGRREELLDRLDNPTIDRLTNLFCIKREWLIGQSQCPMQPAKTWYKQPACTILRVLELEKVGLHPEIYFLKPAHMNADHAMDEEWSGHQVGISIGMTHKTSSGKTFMTFEPWAWEPWHYQKSRIDFLSIFMVFDRTWQHQLRKDMKEVGMQDEDSWEQFNRIARVRYLATGVNQDTIDQYKGCKIFLHELVHADLLKGLGWCRDVFTDRRMVGSRVRPEIDFIEERYFEIIKALAHHVRYLRWNHEK